MKVLSNRERRRLALIEGCHLRPRTGKNILIVEFCVCSTQHRWGNCGLDVLANNRRMAMTSSSTSNRTASSSRDSGTGLPGRRGSNYSSMNTPNYKSRSGSGESSLVQMPHLVACLLIHQLSFNPLATNSLNHQILSYQLNSLINKTSS